MKSSQKGFLFGLFLALAGFAFLAGATNFDRLVLGSGNYGTDPNSTADITFQNDEYITNVTNGTLDFGAAILSTTGKLVAAPTTDVELTPSTDTLNLATATGLINNITIIALGAADTITTILNITANAIYIFRIASSDSTMLLEDGSSTIRLSGDVLLDKTVDRLMMVGGSNKILQSAPVSNNE